MSDRATKLIAFDRAAPPEDFADGLAWVQWLLQSVRARCGHVHFHPASFCGPDLHARWMHFAAAQLLPHISRDITEAWHAAVRRDHAALAAIDTALDESLGEEAAHRSRNAGAVLLRTTRGARYQGALGHYRAAVEAGDAPGHFIVVWAAVGNFFQLSLAAVLVEYLRLEWTLGAREHRHLAPPEGAGSFAALARAMLHGQSQEPRIVRRQGFLSPIPMPSSNAATP